MKTKTFKPILAPNDEANLDEIKYPIMASYKLDGIRCIFKEGQILSRSLKPIVNKQLKEKFEPLRKYSEDHQCILDGEIYSPILPFQGISSCVMTQDFEDKKAIKKWAEIQEEFGLDVSREQALDSLKFYCFDYVDDGMLLDIYFDARYELVNTKLTDYDDILVSVHHDLFQCKEEIEAYFESALNNGFEGLILRDPKGKYKFGRGTLKEGIIYKVKPYRTFDAEITGVVQSTVVDPNAEKTINELGRSVTSKKKDDRILIEKASAFYVDYEGKELKVVLAMTDKEKEAVWANKDEFIGRTIEYKGMLIGAKDVPRHPVMVRFREDKDV